MLFRSDCWNTNEYCSNSDCPIDPSQVSYKIYRNGLGIAITEVQGITEYTDEDLDFNEQYCYTVTYVNGEFESHHSNQACAITDVEVLGCTDANACNYNAEANSDDGDCIYPSGCDSLCGSTAVNDECGVCDGECDYSNDNIPCNGDWEGGYGPTCPTADCEGVPGGETLVDGCDVCGGTNDCYYYFVEGVYAHSSNNDGEIIESTNNGEELFETDFYFSELDSIVFTAAINGEPFEVWNGNYHYNILDSTFCIDWDLNRGSRSSSNIFSNNRGTEECWHADVVYDTLLTTNISYAVITTPDGIVTIEPAVQGCLYSDACNYNADANTQLGNLSICWENDECDICGGTGIPDEECDCNSTLGADTNEDGDPDDFTPHYLDECGVCDADESNNCIQDCYGTWGGDLVIDECNICGGPGFIYQCGCEDKPDGDCDCFGNVLDECGVCGGECDYSNNDILCNGDWEGDGPTCPTADCEGVPGGETLVDECGVCGGGNSSCTDCAGILNGDNVYDECGLECIVNPFADCSIYCDAYPENNCVQDCSGAWGGSAVEDECGVCDGECDYSNDLIPCNGDWEGYGPTCPTADCEGVPYGETLVDECGVCDGPGFPEGECDCNSICSDGSECTDNQCVDESDCTSHIEDECGVCDGPGFPEGECDCNSICSDGSECTDNQCVDESDCTSHVLDECGVCNGIAEGACDCDGNVDLGCGCGEDGPSGCDNLCGSTAVEDECGVDRKSTRLNSSHVVISYAVFCLKKKKVLRHST